MSILKPTLKIRLQNPKIQKLLNNNDIWHDEHNDTWNRKCPLCKNIITSNSKRAFEICLRSYRENRSCNSCGRKKTKQNLIGKIFGKLTVIGAAPYRNTDPGPYWKCKCECGNITEVRTRSLIDGITKTCGSISHKWKGYEEISGKYYAALKSGAKCRNIIFTVTIEEMWDKFLSQNKKCPLSGEILTFNKNSRDRNGTASLDRIDSSIGYVSNNIQWVHKDINKMKNNFSTARFLELCRMVSKRELGIV